MIAEFGQCPIKLFNSQHKQKIVNESKFIFQSFGKSVPNENLKIFKEKVESIILTNFFHQDLKNELVFTVQGVHTFCLRFSFFDLIDPKSFHKWVDLLTKAFKTTINNKSKIKNNEMVKYSQFRIVFKKSQFLIRNLITMGSNDICYSCGYLDESIKILNIKDQKFVKSINFNQSIVTSIIYIREKDFLCTGNSNGLFATWKQTSTSITNFPHLIFWDHNSAISSIAYNFYISLIASMSIGRKIVIRRLADLKKHLEIQIDKYKDMTPIKLLFSSRGYLISWFQSETKSVFNSFIIYSINGELIGSIEFYDQINYITVLKNDYFLLICGKNVFRKLDIISLEVEDLLQKWKIQRIFQNTENQEDSPHSSLNFYSCILLHEKAQEILLLNVVFSENNRDESVLLSISI